MTTRTRIARLAPVALLPPAAFAVHQLRYMLAFGPRAGLELARTGHSYMHSLVPWLIALIALTIGGFLSALGRAFARRTSAPGYAISLAGMWLACSAALIAIFACQELLEGLFATGHPAGLAGVFGWGGWWAIPAALSIGLVLAVLFHGARWVLREVAERGTAVPRRRHPARRSLRPSLLLIGPRLAPVAGGWSDRGPPA
jgi:hypothetical protein